MKLLRQTLGYNFILKNVPRSHFTRRQRLVDIISHANSHTPYYKNTYDYFLESSRNLTDSEFFYAYSHLPIVTKQNLKAKNQDFMSDSLKGKTDLLSGGSTPGLKDVIKHGLIKRDFFTSISTGGTSGIPTFRWLDYADANVFAQSFLESFKLNGWKPGESFVVFYPLKSYFTGAYADHAKTLQRLFGFTMVPFETVTKETVLKLLETLKQNKATLLVIFPCVLQRVAEIMKAENIAPFEHLPYINVSGEFFMAVKPSSRPCSPTATFKVHTARLNSVKSHIKAVSTVLTTKYSTITPIWNKARITRSS
jgi:phenylacetate-coenzyme A ligase PaaK-like adenylate-forming protein